ncbi:MAG: CopG family transcriptional regulator [Chloroflexi bacterium]|nr:CopG family transcriptional regulator [Chloroflexota bacterium]
MVRKQVYLRRDQDRKLKRLAGRRRCTEAELIREALDLLPDPEGDAIQRLVAAGILVPKGDDPSVPQGEALEALEAEVEAWLDALPESLGLSEAILADRAAR